MTVAGRDDTRQRGAASPKLIIAVAVGLIVVLIGAGAAIWFASRPAPEPPPTAPATAPTPPPTLAPTTTVPATTLPPTTIAAAAPPTTAAPAPVERPDPAIAAAFAKGFVAGKTRMEGAAMPPGFMASDESSPDMKVARASGAPAKLEFEVEPAHVRPGDAYVIRVTLKNVGRSPLRPIALETVTQANGKATRNAVAVASEPVAPGASLRLAELPGEWAAGVEGWSLEVRVTTDSREVLRSDLVWQ
jgi:hypothetical protein